MSAIAQRAADRRNWINPSARCPGREDWHGTKNGYQVRGCRGPACREANTTYYRIVRTGTARPRRQSQGDGRPPYSLNPVLLPDTLTLAEFRKLRT